MASREPDHSQHRKNIIAARRSTLMFFNENSSYTIQGCKLVIDILIAQIQYDISQLTIWSGRHINSNAIRTIPKLNSPLVMTQINPASQNRNAINPGNLVRLVMQAIVQGEKKTSLFINALIAYTNNRTQDLIHLFGRKFEQAKQLIDRFWGSLFQATKPVLKPKKRNSKPIETGSAFNGHNFNDIQQAMEEDDDSVFMRSPKKLPIRYRFSRPNSQNTTSDDEGLCTLSDEEKLSVASTAESSRLRHLEMELIELRKQMATLLANQGVAAIAPPLQNAGMSDANTKRSTVANTRTASTAPPPPPPPPPPPVFLKSHSGMPTIKANDLQQVKLNHLASGDRQRPSSENKPASRKMAPSLTEVLKELNTVQLKKLPKSPGGTPLVRSLSAASPAAANKQRVILNPVNREHFQSSCDQGSFLADALRNKFKNVRLSESFNEQENDCSTDEEDLWNE